MKVSIHAEGIEMNRRMLPVIGIGIGVLIVWAVSTAKFTKEVDDANLPSTLTSAHHEVKKDDSELQKLLALEETTLNSRLYKDRSEVILFADFVIKNDSSYMVKDFEIKCEHTADSGTSIDSNDRTIYQIVSAHSTKTIRKFNMGFINSQATNSTCKIVDLVVLPQ